MSKLPAFQFYPGDWRKDPGVQSLSFHDRGIWFEILCLMHESECRGKLLLNGKAMPEEALARLLGLDNQILTKAITTLLTYGVASLCPDTAAMMSRRMVRDEEIRQVRKSCGKLGGNPNLVNQKPTTQVKVDPTPSSSSSISASTDKKNERKPRKSFDPPSQEDAGAYAAEKGFSLDLGYWMDYWIQRDWRYKDGAKMADWKAAMRTWMKRQPEFEGKKNGTNGKHPQQFKSAHERKEDRWRDALGLKPQGDNPPPVDGILSGMPPGGFLAGASGNGNRLGHEGLGRNPHKPD